ncbi:MAG: DUF309 domain-containing protein [Dehalococcoidia bacterium]
MPPQEHARGQRRSLDAQWLAYLNENRDESTNENGITGDPGALLADARFQRGIEQFNAGGFFESHESFEAVWGDQRYPPRLFCLALTKIAAGMAHAVRRNSVGSRRLVTDGLLLLAPFTPHYARCDAGKLVDDTRAWLKGQPKGRHPSAFPRISPA